MMTRVEILLTVLCLLNGRVLTKGPPRVVSPVTQTQIAHVGDTVRLSCPVEADPPALLQWSKDGESIHRGWERFKILSLALRIKNTESEDTGKYQCKATNGFGHVTVDYILIVLHANQSVPSSTELEVMQSELSSPQFTEPEKMEPSLLVRPAGSSVRLVCQATGKPTPSIRWYKDDRQISDISDINQNIAPDERSSSQLWSLLLVGVREKDSGRYRCVISNGHGEISHTYTLTVIEESKAKPILVPPNPQNMTVKQGETASFMCEVRSLDQPHIQWLKRLDNSPSGQTENTIVVNGEEFVVLKTGVVLSRKDGTFLNKLTINKATESDAGLYVCLGANTKGYTIRRAYLNVLTEAVTDEKLSSYWQQVDVSAVLLVVGVPVFVIVVVIIAVTTCVVRRKRRAASNLASTSCRQTANPTSTAVPTAHYPYAPTSTTYGVGASSSSEKGPTSCVDKHRQYSALTPQYTVIADSDAYCDKNVSVSASVPTSVTPTLVQQHHTHLHYYQKT